MKKLSLLAAFAILALSLILVTTQVMAGADAAGPKKTPMPFLTGTPGLPMPFPPGVPPKASPQSLPGPQSGMHGKPMIYRGTIKAVSTTSLTLTLADNTDVTMGLTSSTRIFVPGRASQGDTLVMGMHVVAMAFTDSNNNLVARAVLVIPGQPVRVHRVGTVTAYTAGASITIKATDGNSYTFMLTANTQILPPGSTVSLGSRVTIIAPRVPSSTVWTATGIVVQP